MALGVDDVLGIASGVLGAANTGYNLYTNKRDFDYQKALQQQIFEREDTAVQRRMADLQAAGLNPNLAAGSAANAGSVVARSSTNDVNMGSALDFMQATNTIRQQKQAVENAKIENSILNQKKFQEYLNSKISYADTLMALGFQPKVTLNHDGTISINGKGKSLDIFDTPYGKLFDYNFNYQKNSADLLQKDVDWYTADKISGMALGAFGLGNSFKGWKSLFKK